MSAATTDLILAGRYELREQIGSGGEADVFWGRDTASGAAVVIKKCVAQAGDAHFDTRLQRMQRAATFRFKDKRIQSALDLIEQDGHWYLILTFAEGIDLETHILRHTAHPAAQEAAPVVANFIARPRRKHGRSTCPPGRISAASP